MLYSFFTLSPKHILFNLKALSLSSIQKYFSSYDSIASRVPPWIIQPEYVTRHDKRPKPPTNQNAYHIKNPAQINSMRKACKIAAGALQFALDLTRPGVSGDFIERSVHEWIINQGAYPSALGYNKFPKSLLISINEVCCHGIPNSRIFQEGDLVSYDCVVYIDGHHGDCAATQLVGNTGKPVHYHLSETCKRARDAAISLCIPGTPLKAIGACVSQIAEKEGFQVCSSLCGHFIGEDIHMLPIIPHTYNDCNATLKPGQTFTIEPILTEGNEALYCCSDGWSLATQDGGFGAHWEHTVLITQESCEILTPLRKT